MAPAPAAPAARKGVDFRHPGGKEALIGGGAALLLALAYFWWKGRKAAAPAAAGSGTAMSPTAVLSAWFQDHDGRGGGASGNVTVPNVVGLNDTAADAAIRAVGLTVSDTNEPKGGFGKATATVTSQSPSAGSSVARGSGVSLTFKTSRPQKQPAAGASRPMMGGGGDSGEA
jgi:PASTA domain-containing protein